jgi:hypothetical protein
MEVKSPFCVAPLILNLSPTTQILTFKTHGILLSCPSFSSITQTTDMCTRLSCIFRWLVWFDNARFYAHELNMNHKKVTLALTCYALWNAPSRAHSNRNMVSLVGQAAVILGSNMFFQGQFQIVTHFFSTCILRQQFTLRLKLKARISGRGRWLSVPPR